MKLIHPYAQLLSLFGYVDVRIKTEWANFAHRLIVWEGTVAEISQEYVDRAGRYSRKRDILVEIEHLGACGSWLIMDLPQGYVGLKGGRSFPKGG